MKNFINIFSLLFSMIVLFSCEPGRAENGDLLFGLNNQGTNNPTTVTKLLKKITAPDDKGGTYNINFTYTSGLLTGVTTSNNSYYEVITYSGTNISKIVRTEKDAGQNVITTSDFIYSGNQLSSINQKVTKVGEVVHNGTTKFTFNNAGKPTRVRTEIFVGNTTTLFSTVTSLIQYSGSNVSKWDITTDFAPITPVVPPAIVVNAVFSNFDLGHNPFYTLPKSYSLYAIHAETDTIGIYGQCLNNPKSLIANGASENITYTYDKDGYPLTMSSSASTLKFEYQ